MKQLTLQPALTYKEYKYLNSLEEQGLNLAGYFIHEIWINSRFQNIFRTRYSLVKNHPITNKPIYIRVDVPYESSRLYN